MRIVRVLVGAVGLLMIAVGGRDLWNLGLANAVAAAEWLAGGVVLHDFVLSPILLVVGVVLVRRCSERLRRPLIVGAIVLGTATVVAFPMLGRFGERADNPSLLDRNYTAGWLVLAGLVVLGVLVGAFATGMPARRVESRTSPSDSSARVESSMPGGDV
jgi:hypothetical protein